jgi:hypothetical protein
MFSDLVFDQIMPERRGIWKKSGNLLQLTAWSGYQPKCSTQKT